MKEKHMTNNHIIAILKTMGDDVGLALREKHLPVKLLYALRRSLPEIEAAYRVYDSSLTEICQRYSVTPGSLEDCAEDKQAQMAAEINELLNTETTVRVHTIAPEALDTCGAGGFDPLTYAEIDRLWWLIDEEEG
ncbi:MAG: hypothetical protein LIO70_01135 [Clostridiales bacterium]|nr:hypothetical protein [Clostridiales bacterium]